MRPPWKTRRPPERHGAARAGRTVCSSSSSVGGASTPGRGGTTKRTASLSVYIGHWAQEVPLPGLGRNQTRAANQLQPEAWRCPAAAGDTQAAIRCGRSLRTRCGRLCTRHDLRTSIGRLGCVPTAQSALRSRTWYGGHHGGHPIDILPAQATTAGRGCPATLRIRRYRMRSYGSRSTV